MHKDIAVPSMIALVMITLISLASQGISLIVTFVPGVIITYIFYFLTYYKKPPDPQKILPLYLTGLAVQMLHFTEEYITGINYKYPALFNLPEYPLEIFVLFNMGAYFVFILGAIAMYKHMKPLIFIPLFFIIFGMGGNAIIHLVLSIITGGYFPGLYTSLFYWILAPMIIHKIWRESRGSNIMEPSNFSSIQ